VDFESSFLVALGGVEWQDLRLPSPLKSAWLCTRGGSTKGGEGREKQSAVDKRTLTVLQGQLFLSRVSVTPWCISHVLSDTLTGETKIFLQQLLYLKEEW